MASLSVWLFDVYRMLGKLLAQVWIPNFSNRLVLSPVERKVQVVGMAKLMCENQVVRGRNRERGRNSQRQRRKRTTIEPWGVRWMGDDKGGRGRGKSCRVKTEMEGGKEGGRYVRLRARQRGTQPRRAAAAATDALWSCLPVLPPFK